MLIYLDNSVLNRPFDDQRQPRIWFETVSLILVLTLIETGESRLIWSPIHNLENTRNPDLRRREWIEGCARLAEVKVQLAEEIRIRALNLEHIGLKPLDALHAACAESAGAEIFLTCDDRLIRRYSGKMIVQTPVCS